MGSSFPTLSKTWEIVLNQAVGAASENDTNATQFYNLIASLTDGGT